MPAVPYQYLYIRTAIVKAPIWERVSRALVVRCGSSEFSATKRLADHFDTADLTAENEKLFTLIALNCGLRKGDAHRKNLAIVYDRVLAQARLAPVYDLVTTSVYLLQDNMALALDGTTRWPDARRLSRLGETRMIGTPARVRDILARIADATAETIGETRAYRKERPAFAAVGERMMQQWEEGMHGSLKEA